MPELMLPLRLSAMTIKEEHMTRQKQQVMGMIKRLTRVLTLVSSLGLNSDRLEKRIVQGTSAISLKNSRNCSWAVTHHKK